MDFLPPGYNRNDPEAFGPKPKLPKREPATRGNQRN